VQHVYLTLRYFVLEKERQKMSKTKLEAERQILISISLPPNIVKSIDIMRGDIPRSAYLRKRIIAIVEAEAQKENIPA